MTLSNERRRTFALFLCVPLLCFIIFIVYPIFRSIILSFQEWDGLSKNIKFVGLQNYKDIFASELFWNSLINNIKWLLFSLVVPTLLGLFIAILLDQKIKLESLFQTIFFIPYTITPVAVASAWSWLYSPRSGVFNQFLRLIGLPGMQQVWLGNGQIATYSIMFASLWWSTGFAMLLYFSGLRSIPREFLEAAEVDGAGFWTKLWSIIIPQLLPSTIVVMAMQGISAMRVFDLIYSMTGGGPGTSTHVLATMMFDISFNRFEMGKGSAVAVILFLLSMAIILPYVYHSSKGLEELRS